MLGGMNLQTGQMCMGLAIGKRGVWAFGLERVNYPYLLMIQLSRSCNWVATSTCCERLFMYHVMTIPSIYVIHDVLDSAGNIRGLTQTKNTVDSEDAKPYGGATKLVST